MKRMLKRSLLSKAAGAVLAASIAIGANAASLKMAYDSDPVSLDPHEQLSGATLQLSHMVFDPLVRIDQHHKIVPRLAEKWERINDKTMRFTLRKGVKFHSGNTLTSGDVKWTFDRLSSSSDFKAIFAPFSGLKVVNDYTFDLT
ncbi:MAG: ABC transporter substrate-binding protein, partial [Endozoicomonas sp.]